MAKDFQKEFVDFEKIIKKNNPHADINLIKKAYDFAELHHRGQKRNSGEDYFIHPIAVAINLSNMALDDQTICAGLMHDVLEDTDVSKEEMEKEFGKEITFLVDGVTKLKQIKFESKEEKQAENIRKMVLAMSNDVRVVLIKLADRLHNMRTLEYKTEEKQKQTARETIEIYVPLAHRLGIYTIKWELEDLCFRYLNPQEYYELAQMVHIKRREREAYINEIIETLDKALQSTKIDYEITGRPKSLYSIYKKMKRNDIEFDEIYDLTAVRVLVDTIADCYEVLGKVHSIWKPIPNRIKDYIGQPKPNGYKSLHTTVFGDDSKPFEVQIRTRKMHYECEYGIAAHWKYKENKTKSTEFDERLTFIRQILDWQKDGGKDINNKEFMEILKGDFFSREIYVYSPKGEIYNLPMNSCAIDFAYRVHTEVGNSCVGAKVNGKMVPISQKLHTGDVIEILTSKNSQGPSRDWLNIVQSNQAKSKIKQFFKKHSKEDNIEIGKELLDKEFKKHDSNYKKLIEDKFYDEVAGEFGFPTRDEMYASIGFGKTSVEQVIQKLIKKYKSENDTEVVEEKIDIPKTKAKSAYGSEIKVSDFDEDIEVKLAKCCNPVPGDKIIGYITKGNGISVHVRSCPNIVNLKTPERLIDVYWRNSRADKFPVRIEVITRDETGVLYQITKLMSSENVSIQAMNVRKNGDDEGLVDMTVQVLNIEELNDLLMKLKSLKQVENAYRVKI
ncbi:MAG: bifunctional (p)ppGpp synthetase/guanosine-3',5'-bis(diphosphate) 3'-pyrophosphohydrolase [Peptoniphilaceae bacterium]|nr:bifunctional (p)ppGpp synthetase/guanosine-3',5'-bis(diphosphate) 3'-pyrophosphohydrolase [Peptoniphilaceae bacterium]MDY6019575.1 bifunctional (p)ppGpp synthetase/guanosine-3',5'-bis(diphosphate) 3'-pyrophosphohydrolase [Anaerococcus sp.]